MHKVLGLLKEKYRELYAASPYYELPLPPKEKKVHFSKRPKGKFVYSPDKSSDSSNWVSECPFVPD